MINGSEKEILDLVMYVFAYSNIEINLQKYFKHKLICSLMNYISLQTITLGLKLI